MAKNEVIIAGRRTAEPECCELPVRAAYPNFVNSDKNLTGC